MRALALRADEAATFEIAREPRAGTARRGLAHQARSVRRLGKGAAVGHPSLAAKKETPPPRYAPGTEPLPMR